jgi:hypothetical protein
MNFLLTPSVSVSEGNAIMYRHSIFLRQAPGFGKALDGSLEGKLCAMHESWSIGDTRISHISSSF